MAAIESRQEEARRQEAMQVEEEREAQEARDASEAQRRQQQQWQQKQQAQREREECQFEADLPAKIHAIQEERRVNGKAHVPNTKEWFSEWKGCKHADV